MNSEATPIPVLDQSVYITLITAIETGCLPGTHAHNTHLSILLQHLRQQSSNLSGTSGTNGVSQSNSASVGVHLGHVDAQLAHTIDALAGKCFVQLEDTDIALFNTAVFVEVADGEDGRDTHFVGVVAGHLSTGEAGNGLQAVGVSPGTTGEDGCRGTVGDLRPFVKLVLSSFQIWQETYELPAVLAPPSRTPLRPDNFS